MLTTLRKRVRVIMIIVAVGFVAGFLLGELWRMLGSRGRQQSPIESGLVGKVGDRKVTIDEYRNAVTYTTGKYREENMLRDLSPGDYAAIEERAWNFLVSELTWGRLLRESGIQVSEQEIIEIMKANPPEDIRNNPELFDEQGNFDQQKYIEVMNNPQNQAYFSRYFQELAEMLPKEKFRLNVVNSYRPTSGEINEALVQQNTRWKVTSLYFGPKVIAEQVEPAPDEVRAWYDAHLEDFRTKEVRQLRYVQFPIATTPQDSVDAKEIIDRAYAQLEEGETFNLTMMDFSDMVAETTSAFFPRERLDDATDTIVAKMKPGEYSPPFLTQYGWQMVALDSAVEDSIALRRILVRVKMSAEVIADVREEVRNFVDRALESDFDSVAMDMGLQPRPARPMIDGKENLAGLDLVSPTQMTDWARKAKEGDVMDTPVRGQGGFYVFQLTELRKAEQQPFEEVEKQVSWRVKQEKEKELWRARADQAAAEVSSGMTFEQYVAAHPEVELQEEEFTGLFDVRRRKGAEFAGALLALQPGTVSGVVEAAWGAFIIRCDEREEVPTTSPEQFAQQRQQQVAQQLMQELMQQEEIEDYRDPFSF